MIDGAIHVFLVALRDIKEGELLMYDYNGLEKKKDYWVNHLSEAFENQSGDPKLELEVLTLNINEGHNKELMEQCQTLKEYAQI